MTSIDTVRPDVAASDADRALKQKHRAMWALGDYPAVVTEMIHSLGPVVLEAAGIRPGDRVLDIAAGTGNVAIPAALAGAQVIASDLTPELLQEGERRAAVAGVTIEWQEADAEALPNASNTFDAVTSCVGVMFAPHHQVTADEFVRVCRSGGTIGTLELDARGLHRPAVRDHEAVRARAPARCAAAAAVGQRGARPRPLRRPCARRAHRAPDGAGRGLRAARGRP